MTGSVRSGFLLTTAISGLFFPCVSHAETSEAEVAALRREMAMMRRDMQGEIHRLQMRVARYEHVAQGKGNNAQVTSRTTHPHLVAAGAEEPQPVFAEEPSKPVHHGPRVGSEGHPALPEGPVASWAEFKAASAKEETVHIGGIQVVRGHME